jgi:hypothetical protein
VDQSFDLSYDVIWSCFGRLYQKPDKRAAWFEKKKPTKAAKKMKKSEQQ